MTAQNPNQHKTDGTLSQEKGWLKKERDARRDEVRNKHRRVWKHEALYQHKLMCVERAGVENQKKVVANGQ